MSVTTQHCQYKDDKYQICPYNKDAIPGSIYCKKCDYNFHNKEVVLNNKKLISLGNSLNSDQDIIFFLDEVQRCTIFASKYNQNICFKDYNNDPLLGDKSEYYYLAKLRNISKTIQEKIIKYFYEIYNSKKYSERKQYCRQIIHWFKNSTLQNDFLERFLQIISEKLLENFSWKQILHIDTFNYFIKPYRIIYGFYYEYIVDNILKKLSNDELDDIVAINICAGELLITKSLQKLYQDLKIALQKEKQIRIDNPPPYEGSSSLLEIPVLEKSF